MKNKKDKFDLPDIDFTRTNENPSVVKDYKEFLSNIDIPEHLKDVYLKTSLSITREDISTKKYFNIAGSKNYTTSKKIDYFIKMPSGEIVFTTVGDLEYAFKVQWQFPNGNFPLEISRDGDNFEAMIFFDESTEMKFIPLFFQQIHPLDEENKTLISKPWGSGSQLTILDKNIWDKNKTGIYFKKFSQYEKFVDKYEKKYPYSLILFEIDNYASKAEKETPETEHYYSAFAGFNSEGKIAGLLIKRRVEYK